MNDAYWKAVKKVLYKREQICKQPLDKHLEKVATSAILSACSGLLQLQTPPWILWSSTKHPTPPFSRAANPPSSILESRQKGVPWFVFYFADLLHRGFFF
jgi:hypothetical protein